MPPDDAPAATGPWPAPPGHIPAELLQHEAARHARDVGEREIAEDGGGQERWLSAFQNTSHSPASRLSTVIRPVTGRHDVVEADIEPARPADPAELGVEQQQADQARARRPASNSRAASQHADHLVLPAAAMGRGQHAQRHAEDDADEQRRAVASSSVAGKTRSRSCSTGCAVMTRDCRNRRAAPSSGSARTARGAAGRGRSRRAPGHRSRREALSPTMASTGSIGITRPMKKVTQVSPRKVSATENSSSQRRDGWAPARRRTPSVGRVDAPPAAAAHGVDGS